MGDNGEEAVILAQNWTTRNFRAQNGDEQRNEAGTADRNIRIYFTSF